MLLLKQKPKSWWDAWDKKHEPKRKGNKKTPRTIPPIEKSEEKMDFSNIKIEKPYIKGTLITGTPKITRSQNPWSKPIGSRDTKAKRKPQSTAHREFCEDSCASCGSYEFLDVHHIIHRSKGGLDDPDNLMTLCKPCHRTQHPELPDKFFKV